jgi:hypothetical protein
MAPYLAPLWCPNRSSASYPGRVFESTYDPDIRHPSVEIQIRLASRVGLLREDGQRPGAGGYDATYFGVGGHWRVVASEARSLESIEPW